MADVPAGAARHYASAAEVRADLERAGGDASALCGFGRCFCVKTAVAAFDSLESDAKDSNTRQTMVWLLGENAT